MSPRSPGRSPPPLALFLAAAGVILATRPLRGGDTFWHLSVGRWILETGSLPVPDPFGFVSIDAGHWTPHSPLWAVLVELAYRAGGIAGVNLLKGLLPVVFGLSVHAFLLRGVARLPRLVATGAAVAAVMPLGNPRPYWIPLILLPPLARWVERALRGEAPSLPGYALVSWLWALGHASCLLAIGAPALALLDAPDMAARKRLVAAAAAALGASALTPNGLGLWRYWVDHIPGPFFGGLIKEWSPPGLLGEGLGANALLLMALALWALRRRPVRRWEVGWLLAWTWSYSRQSRHMGLALLAALLVLARQLPETEEPEQPGPVVAWSLGLALALAALVGPGGIHPELPAAALDPWLETATLDRSLHLDYWAPYLSWRSRHRVKSYLDGRNDLYGPAPLREYLAVIRGEPGWEEALARGRFDAVLLPADHPALARIRALPAWEAAETPGPGIGLLRPSARE